MEKDNYVRGSVGGRLSQVMYKRSGWTVNCIVDRGSDGQERATYVLRTSDRHQSSLAPLVNKLRRGVDFDVNSPELPHVIEYRMEADPPLQELELANLRGKTIGHETLRTWSEREFLVFAKSFCDTLLTYQDAGITGVGVRLDEVLWAESEKRVFLLGWEHSRIDDTQPVDMKTAANLWIELLTGHDLETSPHTYRAGPDWEQVSLGLRALLMRMHSSSIDLKRVIHHISRLLDMHSAEQDLFDEALLLDPVQALIAYDFLQRAGPSRNRLLPALQAAKRATDRLVESKLWSVRESILKGEYQDAIKSSTEAISITEASTGVWLSANRWYTGANLLTQVIEKKEPQYDTLARRIEGPVVHLIDALDSQLFEDARTILVEIKTSLLGRLKDEIPELRSIENDLEFQICASQIDADLHAGASSPALVQFGKLEILLQDIGYAGAVSLPEKMVLGYNDESVTFAQKTSGVLSAVVEALLKLLERDYQDIERLFSECRNEFATLQSERVKIPPALNKALHQFDLIEAEVEHLRSVLKFDRQCFEGSEVTKHEWTRAESALLGLESSKIDADLPRWLRASLDLHWVEPLLDLLKNYEKLDSESIEKRLVQIRSSCLAPQWIDSVAGLHERFRNGAGGKRTFAAIEQQFLEKAQHSIALLPEHKYPSVRISCEKALALLSADNYAKAREAIATTRQPETPSPQADCLDACKQYYSVVSKRKRDECFRELVNHCAAQPLSHKDILKAIKRFEEVPPLAEKTYQEHMSRCRELKQLWKEPVQQQDRGKAR